MPKITHTAIPEVLLIQPEIFRDDRGFFLESFSPAIAVELGLAAPMLQDNHSRSYQNVLRGLHYQIQEPQGKLVCVVRGEVFDVAVDLRRSSPTFGTWAGGRLSGDHCNMMWIPPGFAHGFVVLSDIADVVYKVTSLYAPQFERTLLWSDPDVGIDWPTCDPILSAKDRAGTRLHQADVYA